MPADSVVDHPYRIEFGGLVISGGRPYVDEAGCRWFFTGPFKAFDDQPEIVAEFSKSPYDDGGITSEATYGSRVIPLEGWVTCPSPEAARGAMRRLKGTMAGGKNQLRPFTLHDGGTAEHAMAHPDQTQEIIWDRLTGNKVNFDLQFLAPRPRLVAGDGTEWEHSITHALAATETIEVVNSGEGAAPKCQIVLGGMNKPTITNPVTGHFFKIDLDLSGKTVIVDFDSRSIRDENGMSVRGSVAGRLFKLSTGTTPLKITAASYGASADWTVRWSSARI